MHRNGISYAFSQLFQPKSIKRDSKSRQHCEFIYRAEILELLQVIDGSKQDTNLLSFLDYKKIQAGKMCRHIVMVLPYCASCDAMEQLLLEASSHFKNLAEYQILNISGFEQRNKFKTTQIIKETIHDCERLNRKTITLTAGRMLTGSTVEEWDTMLYFKDTSSPQEYDQAIFRLQNQYVRQLTSGTQVIKENLKPQTLLVDFDPLRMFRMQEQKSLVYNANTEQNGNAQLRERIIQELKISPIVVVNHNKLELVQATNILEAVSEYSKQRSVFEEVEDVPVDFTILSDVELRKVIEAQAEFNTKQGLILNAVEGEGNTDLTTPVIVSDEEQDSEPNKTQRELGSLEPQEQKSLANKVRTYYQRLLFFAFLTTDTITSLEELLTSLHDTRNERLARNLGLEALIIKRLNKVMNPFKLSRLDYKIQNINKLARDTSLPPLERAYVCLNKFTKMSESEIITPATVCDKIVNLIPDAQFVKIIQERLLILDLGSKSGEFAVAVYKRALALGFTHAEVRDLIYAIPTSRVSYEFTRMFFTILGLNTANIACNFSAYELISLHEKLDYTQIAKLLTQSKPFESITLQDTVSSQEQLMKFGAIVGNPPYQVSDNNSGKGSAQPLYDKFTNLGLALEPEVLSMIVPNVWFTGGKGLNEFRAQMLELRGLKYIENYITSQDVFPQVNLRGGVNFFLYARDHDNQHQGISITTIRDGQILSHGVRRLQIRNIDIFIPDNVAHQLVQHLVEREFISLEAEDPRMLYTYISSRNPFGFTTKFVDTQEFHEEVQGLRSPVKIYASRNKVGYLERDLIAKNHAYVDCWKVITPFANNIGTNLADDNLNCLIAARQEIVTETYLLLGVELGLNEQSCANLIKYLQTKFVRFLISIAKANQNGTRTTYRLVPLQDFTDASDLDWNERGATLDAQLYAKYELAQQYIDYINSNIKEMTN